MLRKWWGQLIVGIGLVSLAVATFTPVVELGRDIARDAFIFFVWAEVILLRAEMERKK